MIDNYDMWAAEDARRERWRESRPVCESCGEHIQDEYCYETGRGLMCESCAQSYADDLAEEYARDLMSEWKGNIDDHI